MRAREYPAALVAEVGRLGEAGWAPTEIYRLLERRGQDPMPSLRTVERWANPAVWEKHRRAVQRHRARRNARRASGSLHARSQRPEFRRARILALARCGLTPVQISRVMRLDFGGPMKVRIVEAVLAGDVPVEWGRRMGVESFEPVLGRQG